MALPRLPAFVRYKWRNTPYAPPMTSHRLWSSSREPMPEDEQASRLVPAWSGICAAPMVGPDSSRCSGRCRDSGTEATAYVAALARSNWCSSPPQPTGQRWNRMTVRRPRRLWPGVQRQLCRAPMQLSPSRVVPRQRGRTATQPALIFPSRSCRESQCAW